ncbi:unnamed protein product [Porites lobata]|uniref:Uncharacterized protein n=1 Tax=Porites lobata TaxID=104759 RepID=A0ABN8RHX1_9CNID|nr:unnamed protein product [Porites lobata]
MEFCKIIISAIIAAVLNSLAHSAPVHNTPSTVELFLISVLPSRVTNATQEMKNVHQFITSSSYLEDMGLLLPNINRQGCTSSQQWKDKLPIAYKKMTVFRSPLYMAFSYEENQGPTHSILADVLRDISVFVNATTKMLRSEMGKRSIPVPLVEPVITEADLNNYVRGFLQACVDKSIVTLSITDDVVKAYRNYVILHSLNSEIKEASICVRGI